MFKIKVEMVEEDNNVVEIPELSWMLTRERIIPQKGDRIDFKKDYYTVDFICYNVNGNALVVEVFVI